MTSRRFRFLFCLPTTQLNGGVKVIFSLTDRLVGAGFDVDLFSYSSEPVWHTPKANLIEAKNLSDVDMSRYDFVVVSNAAFIPLVLPLLGQARCVFLAEDYESFHHAVDNTFQSFLAESSAFKALYGLPVPIISISRPIAQMIKERTGRDSYYVPVGLDNEVFRPQARPPSGERKRVLFVGNYLMPYKGMRDGFVALERLNQEIPLELVIVTREEKGRSLFGSHSFPTEVHFCPPDRDLPGIIASCDAYCCTSWYEGLGLPALEAFCCGTPVVSTRTIGVDDYATDHSNILLANANDPSDLRDKLRRILTDAALAARLVEGGFETVGSRYDWSESLASFIRAIEEIDSSYNGAGELDSERLRQSLVDLECEGFLTPIETHREFYRLSESFSRIADQIAETPPADVHIVALESIRDDLKRYLSNERAQYYAAFKAKYDLCLLVLELASTPDKVYIPRLLRPHDGAPHATDVTTLTEIRYTKP